MKTIISGIFLVFLMVSSREIPALRSASRQFRFNAEKSVQKRPAGENTHLYLSVSDRHTILHYTLSQKSGLLSLVDSVAVPGTCGSLAVSPVKNFLYAAVRSENSIATFHIDKNSGRLGFVSLHKAAGNPVYLSCDHTGRFL
ncbi:MAG TPA: beta-propeller fold lactonase family protein, partial [Bacteroidales bacterium]|nr:beta-propeller fold lactonase family protein [Bacteroidales bacterium]